MANSLPLTVGSLFSGIGGIEHGLEQTGGFKTVWQVEIDSFCRQVLGNHWPDIPQYEDIRECTRDTLVPVDVLVGGFPCTDISDAGKRVGIEGERSGLWKEYYRLICDLRPRYILVENVAALLKRGMGRVLGDLAKAGYDAIWQVLHASDFGLPHKRARLFIVAYSPGIRFNYSPPCDPSGRYQCGSSQETSDQVVSLFDLIARLEQRWSTPSLCRKDDGLPDWVQRIRALGNAVVPPAARHLGECILEAERNYQQSQLEVCSV